jgi:hypothetical protein
MPKDRVRGCFCVHLQGKAYKLAWFNEDSEGVYVSIGGYKHGAHYSYHSDGQMHTRGLPGAQLPDVVLPRIEDVKVHPMVAQYMTLGDDLISGLGMEFERENESAVTIFLGPEIFPIQTEFILDAYLLARSAECDLVHLMYNPPSHWRDQQLLALNTFDLRNFPNHKLGIAIRSRAPRS